MHTHIKISLLTAAMLCTIPYCIAQKKKKSGKPNLIERTPYREPEKKKDTIAIIYEKIPARKKKETDNTPSLYKTKETVIERPSKKDSLFKKNLVIVYDTVRYRRKPKDEDGLLQVNKPYDTVIHMGSGKHTDNVTVSTESSSAPLKEGSCKCMRLTIAAQDTIQYEDYINYAFIFKNDCKSEVYIHSASFRFSVADFFGHAVKRLRRIDFVKRFDHPEYVRIEPGETYEYRFADDPFFEYQLSRGSQYKFTFMYNNTKNKSRIAPAKTHLCYEAKEEMVTVK